MATLWQNFRRYATGAPTGIVRATLSERNASWFILKAGAGINPPTGAHGAVVRRLRKLARCGLFRVVGATLSMFLAAWSAFLLHRASECCVDKLRATMARYHDRR